MPISASSTGRSARLSVGRSRAALKFQPRHGPAAVVYAPRLAAWRPPSAPRWIWGVDLPVARVLIARRRDLLLVTEARRCRALSTSVPGSVTIASFNHGDVDANHDAEKRDQHDQHPCARSAASARTEGLCIG